MCNDKVNIMQIEIYLKIMYQMCQDEKNYEKWQALKKKTTI